MADRSSAEGFGSAEKPKYVRTKFLDERFQQHRISHSAFGSEKRHLMRTEKPLAQSDHPTHKPCKTEEEYKARHGVPPYFSCKMTFPLALNRQQQHGPADTVGGGAAGRSSMMDRQARSGYYDNGEEDGHHHHDADDDGDPTQEEDPLETAAQANAPAPIQLLANPPRAQQPNAYWQQPPPTLPPIPDYVSAKPSLKKDEWHPLLATCTAAHSSMEATLNPPGTSGPVIGGVSGAFSSHASSPRMMRGVSTIFGGGGSAMDDARRRPSSAGGGNNNDQSNQEAAQPSLTQTAAVLLSKAIFSPLASHSIPANAARSANNLRSTTATTTAGQQPNVQFRPTLRTVPDVQTNNNYRNKTFNDLNNVIIPPPVAFRNLNPELRHVLQQRGGKVRSRVEHLLTSTNPVMQVAPRPEKPPPPPDPDNDNNNKDKDDDDEDEEEEDMSGGDDISDDNGDTVTKKDKMDNKKNKDTKDDKKTDSVSESGTIRSKVPEVRYNPETADWEFLATGDDEENEAAESESGCSSDEEQDAAEYSLDLVLGYESGLQLWNSMVTRKQEKENTDIDPTYQKSPVDEVAGQYRPKVITAQLVSFYSNTLRRPGVQRYLNGRGIRMGSTLTTTTAVSTSSFTTALPQQLQDMNAKSMNPEPGPSSGIGPTPPAAFACHDDPNSFIFKDANFVALITEKGGEVEEINLECMEWISSESFHKIGDFCPNLKLLNLAKCTTITNRALIHIAQNCHLLAYLNIGGCSQITGEAVSSVLDNCTHLEALCCHSLSGIDVDGGGRFHLLSRVRGLRVLDFSYCTNLSDQALVCVAQNCAALELLDISSCSQVGDMGVTAVGSRCSNLNCLIMKLCSQSSLTAKGLVAIGRAPRNLKRLDLSGVTQLEDATLKTILVHLPCMKFLSLSGCKQLSDESIKMLNVNCKQLQRLDISSCQGISLQTLLDLIHDVQSLSKLVVSESCISNAEVAIMREVRPRCKIIRNQFQAPQKMKTVAFKPIEERRKKKPPTEKDKKNNKKGK
eukprot:TRINITY_DN67530_c5_g4_i1.p1 TRINITY_DN67530_c5_g4~~TRINITY_DN67530_c5_g4_i1.p1  ORF type:complete len:1017 (+),score=128.86 TRINITY_DN67530_c5_g4_i1:67-3117(+)